MKTELCKFFEDGKCQKGKLCSFAHGRDELRPRISLTQTTMCHFWANNRCRQGSDCPFAHSRDELRNARSMVDNAFVSLQRDESTHVGTSKAPRHQAATTSAKAKTAIRSPYRSHCPRCSTPEFDYEARFCALCGGPLSISPANGMDRISERTDHRRQREGVSGLNTQSYEKALHPRVDGQVPAQASAWTQPYAWIQSAASQGPILCPVMMVAVASHPQHEGVCGETTKSHPISLSPGHDQCPSRREEVNVWHCGPRLANQGPMGLGEVPNPFVAQEAYED